MGHLGIRIINILLFSTSCFFAASVVNHVADSQLAPDHTSAFQTVTRTEPDSPKRREQNAILERNLFGAKIESADKIDAPPEPVEVVEVVEDAQATELPLQLIGTMAGNPSSLSSAVIFNTRKKKHQVVRLEDTLTEHAHVTVIDIEPGRVVLRNREIIEELLLNKNVGAARSKVASANTRGNRALQRIRDRKARRNRKSAQGIPEFKNPFEAEPPANLPGSDEADAALQRMQNAMSKDLIRDLKPAMNEDGGIDGVLVGNIEADSLLARAGLQVDDVITNLSGIDINSAGAAARALRVFSKCQPTTIQVNGPGGPKTIEITKALLSELNCTN